MAQLFTAIIGTALRLRLALRQWSAVVALLAFQVVPVGVQKTADGRLDISIGFSADQYLQQSFGCGTGLLSERDVQSRAMSAVVDYFPREQLLLSGFFGRASADAEACAIYPPAVDCGGLAPPNKGVFGGVQLSHEGTRLAYGLGIGARSGTEGAAGKLFPTARLRIGNPEKLTFQLDVLTVRVPGQVPMSTLGMGFGRRGFHSERGFIGVGVLPYSDVDNPLTGNLAIAIPVASRGDILVGGYLGAKQARGVSVAARLHVRGGK